MKKQEAKIITIANQKGGVGKTSTALALYYVLKNNYNKVLFIDLDKQTNASKTLRAKTDNIGAYEMLTNGEDATKLIQVINNNDYVISASKRLIKVNDSITNLNNLKNSLKPILNYFDFIVIDTPPTLDKTTLNALITSDYLIVVCEASNYSLEGVKDLALYIKEINKAYKTNIKINGILINKFKNNTNVNKALKEDLKELAKELKTKVYDSSIRESMKIIEAQDLKTDLYKYAKSNKVLEDYKNLTNEILKDLKMKEIN